jgi:anti-anti-sigma regulatory factor
MTDICVVELPERLDITCVEALHLELEGALTSGKSVQLHGNHVARMDSAGIQLVKAFSDEAAKHHQDVVWDEPSDTILEVLGLLNLGPALGLDSNKQEQVDE